MSTKKIKKGDRKKEVILLSLVLVLAFLIRIIYLGVPPMWMDEASSVNQANNILETGLPVMGNGEFNFSNILFHYLLAFFLLFSKTDFSARLVSVFFGLLTIFLAYKFGNEYSKHGGIFSAILFSFFFLEVFYSRQARFYQMFQFFFFLTIYLLYKSKEKESYFYLAILSFLITVDTHIMGIILAPIFFIFIFKDYKKIILSLLVVIFLFFRWKVFILDIISYCFKTFPPKMAFNFLYLFESSVLLFFISVFGLIFSFRKNKRITFLLVIPTVILFIGLCFFNRYTLRYFYFLIFPLLLFSGVFFSRLYDKYPKSTVSLFCLLILFSSNVFIQENFSNVLLPIDYSLEIESSTNYKYLPETLREQMINNTLVALHSPEVEWYIKKPDFILSPLPRSNKGIYVTRNCSSGLCERNSGAPVLTAYGDFKEIQIDRPYYLLANNLSLNHLLHDQNNKQIAIFDKAIFNCSVSYNSSDLIIYYCN